MKNNIFSSVILTAAVIMSAASCEKEIKFKGKQQETSIVLFSTAVPGEELSVTVRQSAFILDTSWANTIMKGLPEANVRAFIEEGSEPLPLTLSETEDEETVFTCGYQPKPGDRIRIEAEADGFKKVDAETTVPKEAKYEIISVRKETKENEEYSDIYVKIRIDDPAEEKNFYRLELQDIAFDSNDPIFNKNANTLGQSTGIKNYFTDSRFDGKSYTFEIFFSIYDAHTNETESFIVNLQALSNEYFEYMASLDAYGDYEDFSIFSEPVQILCNVRNGIGCVGSVTPCIKTVAAE